MTTEDQDFCWPRRQGAVRINVALQGGGAHGAFTWGVLDRLLEDERLAIESVSGTSAGAMNAVVMAEGLAEGGPDRARAQLAEFWHAVSVESLSGPFQRSVFDVWFSNWSLDGNPTLAFFDAASRLISPYQFNPLNINPLRDLLLREVDFATVRRCRGTQLFISATNVQTGQAKVFTGDEVTVDAVMASACLPQLFQAVEIDGVPYWDGGYVGNPVLEPFFSNCESPDVLLVQINPIERRQAPTSAREILDRVNEISFNAPLLREVRSVEFINSCLRRGELAGRGYREIFLHRIGGADELAGLSASSKLNADWAFQTHLRDLGRQAASVWLDKHYDCIGVRGTMDVDALRADRLPKRPPLPA